MSDFERGLSEFQKRNSRSAAEHIKMLAEHAAISQEHALGFVALMHRRSVAPKPVRMHLETPTSIRKGILSSRSVPGPPIHEFPRVGDGWAIKESPEDWNRYWVVMNTETAETVICQTSHTTYPGMPGESFHTALTKTENGIEVPQTVPAPFYDGGLEVLQRAALRLTNNLGG